ncbi:MAG: PilZ domain-containing protein [Deltaproteobacteria bacterium]|nr:PilZ domain-containing protein [Deltaproteobacteria bacterium]
MEDQKNVQNQRHALGNITSRASSLQSGASANDEDGRNRRKFSRVALDALVHVTAPRAEVLFTSRIRDLSGKGVFILSDRTRPIGTGLDIQIEVTHEGHLIQATGIIVHEVTTEEATPMRPAGVGVMFTDVHPDTQEALHKLMKEGRPLQD